ncbi:hypothetical protein MPOCJGCO_3921 [Methylobacterium trifolii]|uniref:Uncharacterized protein n=1 Tax=Methylobacterium trifolii TaxID=1003092 RepID=A0ABQ4U2V0_9HYPH|nr:hypothetical protein MPOCJGCO_3921 [Methylobacterium trifolii]
MRDSSLMWPRISRAPRAQLRPMVSGLAWRRAFQKASGVWPDRVRPERSVIVPEIMMGRVTPVSSKACHAAATAALAFRVSKIVSIRISSAPPAIRPRTCST